MRWNTYIEQMSARGWEWDAESRMFKALGGRDSMGQPIISLRVSEWEPGAWQARYGVPGISYERFTERKTPMAAADDAEAWLREVLAPLRFPWLNVYGGAP